jgi:hypothetical protein
VNHRFRRGTGARTGAGSFLWNIEPFAFGTGAALNVRRLQNTSQRRNETMTLKNVLGIALASVLTASAAHASTLQDAQAPRATVVDVSRGDERVEAPRDRGQDIQAPRGHDTQSPR